MDCTGELGTFYRSSLRSILNISHTTTNSTFHILAGKSTLSIYITKAYKNFVRSWANSGRLVAKVARKALQLDNMSEPSQFTVATMKLTAGTFSKTSL